jgi:carboxyl-terminal processing protease
MTKNNKKWIIYGIILLMLTNALTFIFTGYGNIMIGNKALITVDSQETANGINKLLALKEEINQEYYKEVDNEILMEGAIKGMFESIDDPYSSYFTTSEFKTYMESATGEYEGVGIVVTEDEQGVTYIIAPQKGAPADLVGIKTGDKIVKVNGDDVTTIGSEGVVQLVRGPADTAVELTIQREEEMIDFNVTRQVITAETVDSRIIGDTGYIQITEFSNKTAIDFKTQVDDLINQDITGLVIDLRGNPGGGVKEAVEVADRLLGETIVVYLVDKNGNRTDYNSDDKMSLDMPMVVLINGGSASSAEILAGALQDTGAAILVGTQSFGKGIVQEVISLKDGAGLKVTSAEYFTPNGNNIHEKGLEPNVSIEPTEYMQNNFFTDEEDVQLQKALETLHSL